MLAREKNAARRREEASRSNSAASKERSNSAASKESESFRLKENIQKAKPSSSSEKQNSFTEKPKKPRRESAEQKESEVTVEVIKNNVTEPNRTITNENNHEVELERPPNVRVLERKIDTLESQVHDLRYLILEKEHKEAVQKKKKLDSQFKQKFKQQRLPAWQPILTADTVLPAFFLIGLLFIPLGVALLYFSENVQEFQLDYTDCNQTNAPLNLSLATSGPRKCADVIQDPGSPKCECRINFNLETAMSKNVYMYYGLDNFYQNHRRYVKSRDDKQLSGNSITDLSSDCSPFDKEKDMKIAPCGAIANSMFNDTLRLQISGGNSVGLLKTGIAWPSDKQIKFKNPTGSSEPGGFDPDAENFAFKGYTKPLYWSKPVWELDTETENNTNNGYQNEDLIVWMRTAAFPSFRKLYRRINHENEYFKYSLPASTYTLIVEYNYPVTQFNGAKRMILSTTSFLGGKNNFLGIAYIAVGSICLLLGVVFLIIHIKFGKRAADLNINQSTPYSD